MKRLVVKIGTANLCNRRGQLVQEVFNDFARQIATLMNQSLEVMVVSSGAIRAGTEKLHAIGLDTSCLHKKDLAGVGARHLMNRWGDAFAVYGKEVGQVWVTFGNWTNKGERRSIQSSVVDYLNSGVVIPVINEADVISDREIKLMERGFSENDRLARMVAFLMGADAVLFLTDNGGIYAEDPGENPRAKLYEEININAKPESIGISSGTSKTGTGGMMAKWKEASYCAKKGMAVAIAGNERNVIIRFANGEPVGTKIGKVTRSR